MKLIDQKFGGEDSPGSVWQVFRSTKKEVDERFNMNVEISGHMFNLFVVLQDGYVVLITDADYNERFSKLSYLRAGAYNLEKFMQAELDYANAKELLEPPLTAQPEHLLNYAKNLLGGRWAAAEPQIMKCPSTAYSYAFNVIKGPWPEAEQYLVTNAKYAYLYGKNVLKGPFRAAEGILRAVVDKEVMTDRYHGFAKDIGEYLDTWDVPSDDVPMEFLSQRVVDSGHERSVWQLFKMGAAGIKRVFGVDVLKCEYVYYGDGSSQRVGREDLFYVVVRDGRAVLITNLGRGRLYESQWPGIHVEDDRHFAWSLIPRV